MMKRLFYIVVLLWITVCLAALLLCADTADATYTTTILEEQEDDGSLPGDDIPAREPVVFEEDENQRIEDALLSRARIIEECTITYYCAEQYEHICGTGDGITATGSYVTPYVSCAVDPSVIPYGSTVIVDYGDGELHYYVADDCGGAIKGNKIDLCVETHQEALDEGIKTATVYWVEEFYEND